MGPNTKIWTPFNLSRKNKQFKIKKVKIGFEMIELCQLMSRLKGGIWPILGLKLAILATFFKISTSNLFCPAFTIRLVGKPN